MCGRCQRIESLKKGVTFCNHPSGKSLTHYISKNCLRPPLCIVRLSVFSAETQQPRSGKTNSWVNSSLKLCCAISAERKGTRDLEDACKDS